MPSIHRAIWRKFRVKSGDTLPYQGWAAGRGLLYELLGELGYTKGAEIGVERGINAKDMFDKIPGLHLTCVDPWKQFHKRTDEIAEELYQETKLRLAGCNVTYMRMPSMEAVKSIPDGSLQFVYIDGLHDFDNVMLDMIYWVPKVMANGIVAGHDYQKQYQNGVAEAVRAYTFSHNVFPWYITRDREPSFFWVK